MTYKEGFIAVVKVGGKIMREQSGEIHLPFGSEYSILLKNKESRKAVVTIEIDGQDVLKGKQLIVNQNQDMELEGFLDGMVAKNKFKFIQKTKEIVDYRGDKIDDGMIRVGFRIENKTIVHENHIYHNHYPCYYPFTSPWIWIHQYPSYPSYPSYSHPQPFIFCGHVGTGDVAFFDGNKISAFNTATVSCSVNMNSDMNSDMNSVPSQDEGITVKGSEVDQNFNYGYVNQLEDQEKIIILILKGYTDNNRIVKEPVTVGLKYECFTCGKKHSFAERFCSNCGTFLN